jgi:hypothetical protein
MPTRSKPTAAAPAVPPSFAPVVAAFAKNRAVSLEKGWGSGNVVLKVNKKIFAMTIKNDLVAKLPKERVAELVDEGAGKPFDPRKDGRVMKEWIVVPPKAADWVGLAREAFAFVKKGTAA